MKLYFSHTRTESYLEEFYKPIMAHPISQEHEIILPYLGGKGPSKEAISVCQIVIAEVTHNNTGQGIELGWADSLGKPILCFYKQGYSPPASISMITSHLFPYTNIANMLDQLRTMLAESSARASTMLKPEASVTQPQYVMQGVN